jgi:rhodanese-related sulfurtransferase
MKKIMKLALMLTFVSSLFFMGCDDKDDDNPQPDPQAEDRFEVLKTYLTNNDLDLNDILTDWITTAENVYTTMTDVDPSNDYFIIDIRTEADYTAGHIEWAMNATYAEILLAAEFNIDNLPIIVVCYTGQAAGHAVVALRLSGYTNAKVMKWGMCSWNAETAIMWPESIGDVGIGNANWNLPPVIKENTTHAAPKIMYLATEGADVLEGQIIKLLEGGFKGVTGISVLDNPTDYFINNYWAITDVEHYGNIKDAHRIKPLTLKDAEYVYLNPDATVVTYCWTGQTSSMITAYLTVLGYDAKSLTYGTNSLIHSNLETHNWSDAQIKDYQLFTGN